MYKFRTGYIKGRLINSLEKEMLKKIPIYQGDGDIPEVPSLVFYQGCTYLLKQTFPLTYLECSNGVAEDVND